MSANSLFSTPLAQFIPHDVRVLWLNARRLSNGLLCPESSIDRFVADLPDIRREYAGIVGNGWYTRRQGECCSVSADIQGMFTWHFHPDGSLRFSAEDWLIFLSSEARATVLCTRTGGVVFQKTDDNTAAHAVKDCFYQMPRTPLLAQRRALRILCRDWNCNLEFDDDALIARHLGVCMVAEFPCL